MAQLFPPQRRRPLLAQEEPLPLLQQVQGYHQNQSGAQQLYQQNMAEQARQQAEYQRRLAADEVGIEPYSLFFGRQTEDPSAGFELAPADLWPGSAAFKAAGTGLLSAIPLAAGMARKKVDDTVPFLSNETEEVVKGVAPGSEMIVTHNLTSGNLEHAERMGGLPMPSIGIAKTENPIEGYGEIVLIGDKDMAKSSARNPVAPADSYTTTYPTIEKKIVDESLDRVLRLTTDPIRKIDPDLADQIMSRRWDVNSDEYRRFDPMKVLFLKDQGREDIIEDAIKTFRSRPESNTNIDFGFYLGQSIHKAKLDSEWYEFQDNLDQYLRDSGVEIRERIFKGFTNLGNRRYAPHTIDNVLKEMRSTAKEAAGNTLLGGTGAMRAQLAPRFKNLQEVIKSRDRLVSTEVFQKARDEIQNEFFRLAEQFQPYSKYWASQTNKFGFYDTFLNDAVDFGKRGNAGLQEWYEFDRIPKESLEELREFVAAVKRMPTEYFEGKPNRIVDLSEFKGALVPDDVKQKDLDRLKRFGIDRIEKYSNRGSPDESKASRSKALRKFKEYMFSAAPVAATAGLLAPQTQNQQAQ